MDIFGVTIVGDDIFGTIVGSGEVLDIFGTIVDDDDDDDDSNPVVGAFDGEVFDIFDGEVFGDDVFDIFGTIVEDVGRWGVGQRKTPPFSGSQTGSYPVASR